MPSEASLQSRTEANASIDFERYRTGDLTEKVVSILSIPESMISFLKTSTISGIVLIAVAEIVLANVKLALLPWLLVTVYLAFAAAFIAILLGFASVVSSLLNRMQELLHLLIEVSNNLACDYRQVKSGDKTFPKANEIVEHAYDKIFFPVVEKSISRSFGFIVIPLLFIYRVTIGTCVRILIKRMKCRPDANKSKTIIESTDRALHSLESNLDSVQDSFAIANTYLSHGSNVFRTLVLGPLYFVFAVLACLSLLPLFILYLFQLI